MVTTISMSAPIWTPSPVRASQSNMARFIATISREYDSAVHDYPSLYDWSIKYSEVFWPAVWDFCGVKASKKWEHVLEHGDKMPGASWFCGSQLNFADNLLRKRDTHPAIVFRSEHGSRRCISYGQLYDHVSSAVQALKSAGVVTGDRVVGYLPNIPETVIAMLATASLGAIWSSCSPDFGITGVLDRFGQIKPKVLFATDGYTYNGKAINTLNRLRRLLDKLPSVEKLVVIPFLDTNPDIELISQAIKYEQFVLPYAPGEIKFEQLPFNHPVYIMYSSGTTGMPKCIVHGAGGTLLQHLKEHVLHTDLKSNDIIFYFTTCGWMMWNWLVSALASGATVMLYDGAPFHPNPRALFDLIEQEGISIFGTSAKYLSAVNKAGVKPIQSHELQSLRTILSTGSPLAPESFDYVYNDILKDVQLSSISGGTDIISCFALGSPVLPVYRGELQCLGLGMKVEVYDEHGHSVRSEKGELVCTAPFPSMPIGFWNDPTNNKYFSAYFRKFPHVWAQGDYAELTEHDGLIIYGRADAVLNPGGVRIGTAEIYRQVEKLTEVLECLAVGQEWKGDTRIVLFVHLRAGLKLNAELIARITSTIRENTTPRHVPAKLVQVVDIPRTISGKIVELAVQNVIHHRSVKNIDALANPEALELFQNVPELNSD
jgi:acetoacetyl-CoA synthetase